MAVDVATLAIKVDTTDLRDGEVAMNKFAATGAKAEKSIEGVGRASANMGKSAGASANNLRTVGLELGRVAQQGAVTGNYLQALTVQLGDILPFLGVKPGLGAISSIADVRFERAPRFAVRLAQRLPPPRDRGPRDTQGNESQAFFLWWAFRWVAAG